MPAMGWDAIATLSRKDEAWQAASDRVKERAGSVDGGLEHGYLDCSNCGIALEAMTGRSAWDERGWTVEEVALMAAGNPQPDEEVAPQDRWAYESAREFLLVCAQLKSGVRFSF